MSANTNTSSYQPTRSEMLTEDEFNYLNSKGVFSNIDGGKGTYEKYKEFAQYDDPFNPWAQNVSMYGSKVDWKSDYNADRENKQNAAARSTGDIASQAANTAVRQSTNAQRSAGIGKGQAALAGQNTAATTYGNTYQANYGANQTNLMNQLQSQLEGSNLLNQMNQDLHNERSAQGAQLASNVLGTVADTATGFLTGGWGGAAAGFLSDERLKESPDGIDDKKLESAVNEFMRLKAEVDRLKGAK